jgi:hypothetical protein
MENQLMETTMQNCLSKQLMYWNKLSTMTPVQRLLASYLLTHSDDVVVEKFFAAVEGRPRKFPVYYDFTKHRWVGVETIMDELKKLFPNTDIDSELEAMKRWLEQDPVSHRKKNYRKFIIGWLSRSVSQKQGESPEQWAKRMLTQVK